MSNLYRDNPFARLGLRAVADAREVRRRIEEAEIRIRLGSHARGLEADRLREISRLLESPSDRLEAELLWLHTGPREASPDPRNAASVATEIERLMQAALTAAGQERVLITHDLAVLRHAAWLEESDRTAGQTNLAALQLAYTNWSDALLAPDLERYFAERSEMLGAPKVDAMARAGAQILRSIAQAAEKALENHDLVGAAGIVAVLKRGELPGSAPHVAAGATASLRGEIGRGLAQLTAIREGEGAASDAIRSAREVLVNSVLGPFARYELVDPHFQDDALRDRVALAARQVSVDAYNKTDDANLASAILEHALSIAATMPMVSQLAIERAQVRFQFHWASAIASFDTGAAVAAAAHAELADEFAGEDKQRVAARALADGARKRVLPAAVTPAKAAIADSFLRTYETLKADIGRAMHFQPVSYAHTARLIPTPVPTVRSSPPSSSRRWVAVAGGVLLLAFIANANARPSSTPAASTFAAATRSTTTSATARPSTQPPVVTTAPPTRPSVAQIRPVLLRPDQIIIPFGEFPLAGYNIGTDRANGSDGWLRTFDAASKDATGYYFFSVRLRVAPPGDTGASLVAAQSCQLTDPEGRTVKATEIRAEVLGDGAKACRFDIGDAIAYDYYTAERNVLIVVRSNPWIPKSDAASMIDSVRVARAQVAIIQRVAPR